eukprot:GHRR01009032.1.p1 GENE.GHRR01009032.1~~GHRR01009032.1.p1  ORF type:complete len:182 (+),score=40.98 GHRR01009032.1:244-789(+)
MGSNAASFAHRDIHHCRAMHSLAATNAVAQSGAKLTVRAAPLPACHRHDAGSSACRQWQLSGQLRGQQRRSVTPTSNSSSCKLAATPRHHVYCASANTEENLVELEVKVEGMVCGGCSSRVEEALKGMHHVKAVQVDLESKLATVQVEARSLIDAMNMLPKFVDTIKELGFEAEPHIEYSG